MRRMPTRILLLLTALLLAACTSARAQQDGTSGTPAGPSATVSGAAAAATSCDLTVGSQLRERSTVSSAGSLAVLAGALPCPAVGVWVGTFTLDADSAADPVPRFAGRYDGTRALTVRLPPVSGRCSAAAIYFAPGADLGADTGQAVAAALAVRSDLAAWPAVPGPTVPAGAILRGHPSGVLAATVTGDPSHCSPGESATTPPATVGACWLLGTGTPAAGAPSPSPGTSAPARSGFRAVSCTGAHTDEVYWAETLTPAQYQQQGEGLGESAATWARERAGTVCSARSSSIRLAGGLTRKDVLLEQLWPDLQYPPATASSWSKAQIVCLVRWQNGRSSTQRLLQP